MKKRRKIRRLHSSGPTAGTPSPLQQQYLTLVEQAHKAIMDMTRAGRQVAQLCGIADQFSFPPNLDMHMELHLARNWILAQPDGVLRGLRAVDVFRKAREDSGLGLYHLPGHD